MSRRFFSITGAVFGILLAQSCHAASLTGNVLQASYEFPDLGTAYPFMSVSTNPFTVGAGEDTVINIENVTFLSVDFDEDSLLVTLNTTLTNPTWTGAAQNGPVFNVVSGVPFSPISSVVSSSGGPVSAFLSGGSLVVNWAGMPYMDGDTVTVEFSSVSAVPLPAALPLLAGGIGGLGALSWWRKRKERRQALTA